MMAQKSGDKTVVVCDTQPISMEGLKAIINGCPGLRFAGGAQSLEEATLMVRLHHPDLLILDKSLGMNSVLEWMQQVKSTADLRTDIILWGASITEAEALRFLQAGVRGIVRKSADLPVLAACLESVASGSSWMAESVFGSAQAGTQSGRSDLTPREHQVMELVEQGYKNREIARELGIRPGTVKIHLKHIFEKTGVRGRYGLALNAMKERGTFSLPRANGTTYAVRP
jgi:DNA-binding NarL/FixJ family response regulator